jgi:hypothetical protein
MEGIPYFITVPPPAGHGDQFASIQSGCGTDSSLLATGTGDFTQPDSVQAWGDQGAESSAVSFNGPILSLKSLVNPVTPTAIVRNLKTGNYEAYRLSLSCSQ